MNANQSRWRNEGMPRRRKEMLAMTASESLHQRSPPIKEKPQQRNAANARERARMRVLSRAFCRLKTTLPWVPADTKLSKLDTLRLATTYIAHLRAVLIDGSSTDSSPLPSHPLSMVSVSDADVDPLKQYSKNNYIEVGKIMLSEKVPALDTGFMKPSLSSPLRFSKVKRPKRGWTFLADGGCLGGRKETKGLHLEVMKSR